MKKSFSAFSLVELSIVILIISIIITGALSVSRTSFVSAKNKLTQDRLNEVYKALTIFLATNKRLPCPAVFTDVKSASTYGTEAATPGTCTSTLTGSGSGATNLVWGMIPIRALNLPKDFAEDGYETRFSYIVDKRFTKRSAGGVITAITDGFEYIQGSPSPPSGSLTIINVKTDSTSGADLTTYAILAIVSHGPDKLGGYSIGSATQNGTTGIVADETANIYAATYDNLFVANSTNNSFDDVVLFKTKTQLLIDAGLEYVICPSTESNRSSTTCTNTTMQFPNAAYGSSSTASTTCAAVTCTGATTPTRICGKYGVWGVITNDCS